MVHGVSKAVLGGGGKGAERNLINGLYRWTIFIHL